MSTVQRILLPPSGHLADANAHLRHPADRGTWIWHPGRRTDETAVLRFRLRFELTTPAAPLIHVTADQRFQLRGDGIDLTFGPDRCDIEHWTVHSLRWNLAAGVHELEAIVWWIGEPPATGSRTDQEVADDTAKPPMAQISWSGGFLFFTEDLPPESINTGTARWQVEDLTDAVRMFTKRIPHYFDVGPSFDFDLPAWNAAGAREAVLVESALAENFYGVRRPGRCLYPATLPEQRRETRVGGSIRAVHPGEDERAFTPEDEAIPEEWKNWLAGQPVTLAPRTAVTVLWDLEDYFCGYPRLTWTGGRGARVEWEWAESLYEEATSAEIRTHSAKGNRNEIRGKSFLGVGDAWRGEMAGALPGLWWRAGRYVRLRVRAGDEPLTLAGPGLLTTGYPFDRGGDWRSSDAEWNRLMPIFERSFRCSAHETWTDTPYYEQMCYVFDTMLHMLSNYAWFPDDRISRRALEMYDWSRRPSGLVAERYPSAWRQESVTFSMYWPMMIRDFVNWKDDPAFVRSLLPGMRSLLAEIEGLRQDNGLLVEAPGWPFVDWVPGWPAGCGPGVREGDSSLLNLIWVLSLQAAAEVESVHGDADLAARNRRLAERAFAAVVERFWDDSRGLFLDTPGDPAASEHAQFLALLTGWLDEAKTRRCRQALREEKSLARATISASFNLLDALYRHGEEAELHRRLAFWRDLPDRGFKCTPEGPEPTRSDAHAWGAHPAWHSLASIAGIRPAAPGFRRVRIAPCPGEFRSIECSVVHPRGKIDAALEFADGGLKAEVCLPEGVTGEILWRGKTQEIPSGKSRIGL